MNVNHPIDFQKRKNFIAKKVTLLACPWVFQGDPEFQSQQLGLDYIGAYLVECGHQVAKYIDPMLCGGQFVFSIIWRHKKRP